MTKEEFTTKFLKEQQRRRKTLEYDIINFKPEIRFKAWQKYKKDKGEILCLHIILL
ncbi:hypothetical protein JY742_10530 [Clostridioides difficile]|nr:hypothetical protein [Clostridioides difficile]